MFVSWLCTQGIAVLTGTAGYGSECAGRNTSNHLLVHHSLSITLFNGHNWGLKSSKWKVHKIASGPLPHKLSKEDELELSSNEMIANTGLLPRHD